MSTASLKGAGATAQLRPLITSVIQLVMVAGTAPEPSLAVPGLAEIWPSLLGGYKSLCVAALSSFITWAALSQLLGKPHHQRDIISFD